MLGINRKHFWQGSDSNPEPTAWEPCCPTPTAVIYFWIKRVGNFGLKKKEKRPYWMNNFSCILHILRKIIRRSANSWILLDFKIRQKVKNLIFQWLFKNPIFEMWCCKAQESQKLVQKLFKNENQNFFIFF